MNKREALEEKQRRWMDERKRAVLLESKGSESFSRLEKVPPSLVPKGKETNRNLGSVNVNNTSEDKLIEKLTEKLSGHIREEIKKEMRGGSLHNHDLRDAVADRMEGFLQAELHTHTCKMCTHLMSSPHRTPTILFPCGHSFCADCVQTCRRSNNQCPLCRENIESAAVNQSLKNLIDQFVTQKAQVTTGSADMLDEVFPSSSSMVEDAAAERQRSQFAAQLQALAMRRDIIRGQQTDVVQERSVLATRRTAVDRTISHLKKEEESVARRLREVMEEQELVLAHLAEQQTKRTEVVSLEQESQEKSAALQQTLESLEVEMEKLNLLCEGIQNTPNQRLRRR